MACAWKPGTHGADGPRGSAKIIIMTAERRMKESFEDLALPLLASLYNHACWLVQGGVEAEDLVQETLTKALRAFDSFEPDTNFKAWIFRILRNTFLSSRTAIAATRTVFLEDRPDARETADAAPSPEAELIRLNNQALIHHALEQLAPDLREVILLCDLEELKYREIAAILDVPIGTVMSRLARARQMLRRILTTSPGERI
ncbi:MAG: sigma-70 family RNA polymerase sigma factor [Terracidiphilus sp.]|jgi:RNA polymerase sigma-70 factor (ECF subfamily)